MENIEKYLNKFYDFVDKIGKHNFVLIVFIFVALLTTTLYQTFSLYTESEGLSLIDGIETYSFILNSSNATNSVTVAAGNRKYIDITVSNESETKLKYGLYYSSVSDLTDAYIGYLSRTKYLPNGVIPDNSSYIVTLKVVNNSLNDITIDFSIKYGFEDGGELSLNDREYWLSEIIYGEPLSSVSVGSYVAYTGDSENGCDATKEINGWTSCSGKNANYVDDTDMGYCLSTNSKFTVNGWRVGYIENDSAYLVSAGAPECMCTASNGTSSSSCSSYLSSANLYKHFDNMDDIALKYCNSTYAKGGKCDGTTSWAMDATDFEKITGSVLSSDSCYGLSNDESCGYNNELIDNGGFYWFATSTNSNAAFNWHPLIREVASNETDGANGVRPILALDSSVTVVGGKGTYEEPYLITNPEYVPPEEPVVPDGDNLHNSPNLDNGNLIPVYYDDTVQASDGTYGVWKKADSSNKNNSWYDYENKMWANAVIIGDSTKKATYQTATVGTTISDSDITAFYVWIPRYKYRVWNINRQGISETGTGATTYAYPAFSNGIEIEFESGTASTGNVTCTYDTSTAELETNLSDKCVYNNTDDITTASLNTNYTDAWYTHPAFTFGTGEGSEKTGFWIGKFETSTDTSSACYTSPSADNCNNTNQNPRILPNVSSLRFQTLSNQFTTSKKFQNYLSSVMDAHMLTNLEWGAVAYLIHSIYGLCTEIDGEITCEGVNQNNSSGFYTGRSGGAIAGSTALNLANVYSDNSTSTTKYNKNGYYDYKGYKLDYSTGEPTIKYITKVASTTGNVTGVYDMSGGSYEYVMGNMVNSSNAFYPSSAGTNWNGSTILDSKFYNSYSYGTSSSVKIASNRGRLGDATAEVLGGTSTSSAWKPGSGKIGSYSVFVYSSYSWFSRGGYYNDTNSGAFYFDFSDGTRSRNYSFRSSLS